MTIQFSIHHETAAPIALKKAILLYGTSSDNNYGYATVHDVKPNNNGAPVIRPGRAMSHDALTKVVSNLALSSHRHHGLLPANVLALGSDRTMWWLPPGERTFYFQCNEPSKIGHRAGKGFHPGLIFVASANSMWVFSVKGAERPTTNSQLFHAPMMNVYKDGLLCTGTTPLPNGALAESIPAWTDSFFKSAFTHPNQPKALRYKGGLHVFWKDMLDGKFHAFPEKVLVPFNETTVGILAEHVNGYHNGQ